MNVQDKKDGECPLHHAVDLSSVGAITHLLDKVADIALKTERGQTSLHKAALTGSITVIKLLLDR